MFFGEPFIQRYICPSCFWNNCIFVSLTAHPLSFNPLSLSFSAFVPLVSPSQRSVLLTSVPVEAAVRLMYFWWGGAVGEPLEDPAAAGGQWTSLRFPAGRYRHRCCSFLVLCRWSGRVQAGVTATRGAESQRQCYSPSPGHRFYWLYCQENCRRQLCLRVRLILRRSDPSGTIHFQLNQLFQELNLVAPNGEVQVQKASSRK